jgi:hypothetical protein
MTYVAIALSMCALGFTVGSFWWLHARTGSVGAARPAMYALTATEDRVRLRLPLVLHNSGPKALIVGDLQLVLDGAVDRAPLRWITTRSSLRPKSDDGHEFATPFAIQGRGTREVIAEFGDNLGWSPPPASCHQVSLEAQIHPSADWEAISTFEWWAPPAGAARDEYVAYRNEPSA